MSEEARVALPVIAVSAIFLWLAWRPWRSSVANVNWRGHWAAPFILGLTFVLAFAVLEQARGFQLKDRWHCILPITGVATALGIVATLSSAFRFTFSIKFATGLAMAIICGWLFCTPSSIEKPLFWKLAFSASVLVTWLNLETFGHRRAGAMVPLILVIVLAGLSMVLLQGFQAKFSLLATALAACMGVITVFAMLRPQINIAPGGVLVVSALLPALIVLGLLYGRNAVGWLPFLLIGVAPGGLWILNLPLVKRGPIWQRSLIAVAGAVVLVAGAVLLAASANEG